MPVVLQLCASAQWILDYHQQPMADVPVGCAATANARTAVGAGFMPASPPPPPPDRTPGLDQQAPDWHGDCAGQCARTARNGSAAIQAG